VLTGYPLYKKRGTCGEENGKETRRNIRSHESIHQKKKKDLEKISGKKKKRAEVAPRTFSKHQMKQRHAESGNCRGRAPD